MAYQPSEVLAVILDEQATIKIALQQRLRVEVCTFLAVGEIARRIDLRGFRKVVFFTNPRWSEEEIRNVASRVSAGREGLEIQYVDLLEIYRSLENTLFQTILGESPSPN